MRAGRGWEGREGWRGREEGRYGVGAGKGDGDKG